MVYKKCKLRCRKKKKFSTRGKTLWALESTTVHRGIKALSYPLHRVYPPGFQPSLPPWYTWGQMILIYRPTATCFGLWYHRHGAVDSTIHINHYPLDSVSHACYCKDSGILSGKELRGRKGLKKKRRNRCFKGFTLKSTIVFHTSKPILLTSGLSSMNIRSYPNKEGGILGCIYTIWVVSSRFIRVNWLESNWIISIHIELKWVKFVSAQPDHEQYGHIIPCWIVWSIVDLTP